MPYRNPDGSWSYSNDEHLYTQQQNNVANFAASFWNDPALSNEVKAIVKKKHPNLQITDYDLQQQFANFRNEENNRRKIDDEQRKFDADERNRLKLRKEAQDKYGLTDEGMVEVEDHMRKNFIGNYDVAAHHFVATRPSATDNSYDHQHWNHAQQPGFDDIAKDPERWGRIELEKAVKGELMRQRAGGY